MSNTPTTIRLTPELLADLDAEAVRLERSRSWVILRRLHANNRGSGSEPARPAERTRDRAAVPVLPKAKGSAKRLHPLQSVRGELAGGGDAPARLPEQRSARSSLEKCPHGKLNAAYCQATGGGC